MLQSARREVQRPRLRLPHGSGLALVWNVRPRRDGSHLRGLQPEEREHDVLDEDVARVSPLKHVYLNCLGRYCFAARPPATRGPAPAT